MIKDLINVAKYKRINKKLRKENEMLRKNSDMLAELEEALKVRCIYLEKREDKLFRIEKMVEKGAKATEIRKAIKEDIK